ncbi:phytanoyl-CoA dioxygenase family protein [Pusillimonas sp. MFBS29]|uniref:phytanoyl-CoA dioxygenase family protein n=1 Tax=Pusillimonas sp. MFBS29 TaxID=2886690 RepID=UPI001D121D72|nr:phytanoyl-CoA dioxygenase family protein [Pusillimonas sp. MFBS29]MCC2597161.1 phytanoyl-CoA dioxygenase family protein [Pusillimonas sp. MFBS29]
MNGLRFWGQIPVYGDQQLASKLEQFDKNGYVVLERVIPPADVNALILAMRQAEERRGFSYARTSFEGFNTVRINNLLVYDELFWTVPLQSEVLQVAEAILDRELLLSSLCTLTLGPGQTAQPLHDDMQQLKLPRPRPTLAVNAVWALTDFTEDNGATLVVPGSHKFPEQAPYGGDYPTVAATMPAGSVMLFDGALWHKGGANTTDERRYAISCYYCAGWLRQQENLQLGIPQDIAARFPRRLQELCGYGIYKGQYGHIDNQDPITLLGREAIRTTVWEATDRKLQAGKAGKDAGQSRP